MTFFPTPPPPADQVSPPPGWLPASSRSPVKVSGLSFAQVPLCLFRSELGSRHLRERPAVYFTCQRVLMCSSCLDTGFQSMVPEAAAAAQVRAPSRFSESETQELGPSVLWLNKTSGWFWCLPQLLLQCIKLVVFAVIQEVVEDREAWRAAVCGVTKSLTWLRDWTTTTAGVERTPCGLIEPTVRLSFFEKDARWDDPSS